MDRLNASASLPSGRKIRLSELTGAEERAAAVAAGDGQGPAVMSRRVMEEVFRSVREIDEERFDPSAATPELLRDQFNAKDWQCVLELFGMLHRPSDEEGDAFRASVSFTAEAAQPESSPR